MIDVPLRCKVKRFFNSQYNMQLSKNFTLQEMVFSHTAVRLGFDNTPSGDVIEALRNLCEHTLQPLREALGKPIRVTSGYRSPLLNMRIGGQGQSQHLRGEAADIQVPGMTTTEVIKVMIEKEIPFDQVINEFDSWVHISFTTRRKLRRGILVATRKGRRTVFQKITASNLQ